MRGVKRGHRKPLEPSAEFQRLHANATNAFISGKLDLAEDYVNSAIMENPEMFIAHSLLSEIHMAQGDKQRASLALFNAAHTRPRDVETWGKLAELVLDLGQGETSSYLDAVYCYNRIIGADRNNIDARFRRAELNLEGGRKKRALHDYNILLEQLPHNLTVLRYLAESCTTTPQRETAIQAYDRAIEHYANLAPDGPPEEVLLVRDEFQEHGRQEQFSWSDANIYAELFLLSEKHHEGIAKLKAVSRWLQGRAREGYWNQYTHDDREMDAEDTPRRVKVAEFESYRAPTDMYGNSLPLELRIRLGIFRLKLGKENLQEAVLHFEWLDPDMRGSNNRIDDYPDLFREVADNLKDSGHLELALRFYEPLQLSGDTGGTDLWTSMAACYRSLQRWDEAETCYRAVIDLEKGQRLNATMEIAAMFDHAGLPARAKPYLDLAAERRKRPSKRLTWEAKTAKAAQYDADPDMPIDSIEQQEEDEEDEGEEQEGEEHDPGVSSHGLIVRKYKPRKEKPASTGRRRANHQHRDIDHSTVLPEFMRLRDLKNQYDGGSEDAMIQWMTRASALLERFREVKLFFPLDKHIRFYGYSTKALRQRWLRVGAVYEASYEENEKDDYEPESPERFADVRFDDWLDCFLQYAVFLARAHDATSAYNVINVCRDCVIWVHSPPSLFLINVIHVMCAVYLHDHKTINEVMRFFLKDYQFVTDAYRLFAAVNRLTARGNVWYNMGPTQKFLLRQIKAVDFSLQPPPASHPSGKLLAHEKPALSSKDINGQPIAATDMDVALLVLYGHCLYAGQSYAYSLNYFYRAHALDPENSMITLTLALGYLHYAMKRQSENRQLLIVQGLSFLQAYHASRCKSQRAVEMQEAEFNVGKAYHMLSLNHLALPYYERVLGLSEVVQKERGERGEAWTEDYAKEAAYALQGIWMLSGQVELAREVTEKWLVL
jgi:general transcription factor 3C polypeptide 3 (transcription factor C subunit 4)